ncbi:MAG TPA: hypothetical protein VFX01_06315 [Methylophilaceae bacterium]|nr:hypothetical protein [Methylophilaceae bacterium]
MAHVSNASFTGDNGSVIATAQTQPAITIETMADNARVADASADDAKGGNMDMFWQLIKSFESADMPYCILAGYDQYPQHIASDIDFMIPESWSDRLPAIIAGVAAATGAQLIQALTHETTATYYVLARLRGASIAYLHPDSSSDYRRSGRLWLHAETMLENRRRHPSGFWVPSAADAFVYYLIKKIDKGQLNASQAAELTARYAEDPQACTERLFELLPEDEAGLIHNAVVRPSAFDGRVWTQVQRNLPNLRQAMHMYSDALPWHSNLRQHLRDLRRVLRRCLQPTGLRIVFLGPDGSGKSSVINQVSQQMAQAFRRVEYRHLRPGKLPQGAHGQIVVDPHGAAVRGKAGSVAKLLHFWASYVAGSVLWTYPHYLRSTLIIFDRYYQDLLADPVRYRYAAPLKLARLLGRLLPQPDMVFILDAPPEVLQARKQEVPFAESQRQRAAYLALAREFRHASIIDSSQPLDQVVNDILSRITAFLESRTAQRLGLADDAAVSLCKSSSC